MGFDFFKKKKGQDSADHADELQFDDIDTSGEFLTGSEAPPARPQDPYPAPPPPAPRPQASPPVSPPPAPFYPDDDITIINRPPVVPPPYPAAPPANTPAPPGPPAAPGQPVPPRPPQQAVSPPPVPGPPAPPAPAAPPAPPVPGGPAGLAPDEVTQVLNKPVSITAVVAWLVVVDGPLRGEDFRLPTGTVRLGLNPTCEIQLTGDTFISSQHAEISFRSGAYWLRDLGSTNGLFVNEVKVSEVALNDGDQVKAGRTSLIYKSLAL
jgi:FHA domain